MVEAVRYYEEEEEGLGARLEAEIVRCVRLILQAPEAAPVVRSRAIRRKNLQGFPYGLIYTVEPDRIRIVAIAHHRRRPGYWSRRR